MNISLIKRKILKSSITQILYDTRSFIIIIIIILMMLLLFSV